MELKERRKCADCCVVYNDKIGHFVKTCLFEGHGLAVSPIAIFLGSEIFNCLNIYHRNFALILTVPPCISQ